jgi:pimeloyl-ACP methyl ester carboxylesterase
LYCRVDGLRIYYERYGTGESNVLLVHGAAQDTLSWRFNAEPIAEQGHTVWVVDLPGHGKSALAENGPKTDLGEYADFLLSFLKTLSINEPFVVGHSMSGGTGLLMALKKKDEGIRGVVLVDGAAFTSGTYGDDVFELVSMNPAGWFEVNFRTICSKNTDPARIDEIAFDVQRCAPMVAYNDILAYGKFDIFDRIDQIKTPCFFIHGEDDWSITPDMARKTQARLMCPTEFHLLPGVGHFPHTEAPEKFNPVLIDILSRL